ncbi:MAG: shikimate dehydrogenase [Clostridium sp.]|nr:shikimate dehydrogenase [Clostridium sp.]
MINIDGKTRLIGLIGNPVEHTLSPVIHNGISERMNHSSVYVPFKVEADGLAEAVEGAYALNVLGLNVTVPHKNQVMKSLVEIDEAAEQIGAVNTLVRLEERNGYKGYNTDMLGLKRQMKEDGIVLAKETVVILGAGGAARAVVYMCMLEGAGKIYLLNRTVEKAQQIAESMQNANLSGCMPENGQCSIVPMALSDYSRIQEDKLIVFQATSIGLSPNVEEVVLDDETFYQKVSIGVDLIYNPANTKFMQMVAAQGGRAYNALKMLLYQGVIAYELWHNITVPREIVEEIYVDLKRSVYPKDNVVLIGFMGSGKTTFGKEFAKRCGMDFLDTDDYIEKQAGKTIADIFAEDGEQAFRSLETETLRQLRDSRTNTVFATGGGMPLREENARLLKELGRVLYLTAAPQVIYERVKGDTGRPLLQCAHPYEKICSMMKERKPLYERAADASVDTNSNDLEEIMAAMREEVVTYV